MTVNNPPGFLQNAGATHTAEQMRNWFGALISGVTTTGSLLSRQGVHPDLGNELLVTQTGSPSMAVIVKSGHAVIAGTEGSKQGVYIVMNDADVTLSITAAHATLNRIDSVVFKVEDQVYSGSNNTSSLVVVTGTPASSPSPPALPNNSIELARVSVVALDTSITNSEITDMRRYFAATGGVIKCTSITRPTSINSGQLIYEYDTSMVRVYDGATWQQVYPHTGLTKIAENLLVGTASSITFSSIPSTYRELVLQYVARGDTASTNLNLFMRFNGDTGTNYDEELLSGIGAAASAAEVLNTASPEIGTIPGASSAAGASGVGTVFIPFYAGTNFWKQYTSTNATSINTGTGTMFSRHWAGRWRNTAAINTVAVFPVSGNFVAGSSFALYGMP